MKPTHALNILLLLVVAWSTACTYTQKIKDGTTAFEQKQYALAGPMLEKEYRKAKDAKEKARMAFMAGQSYQRMNDSGKALEWFGKAHSLRYGEEALHEYAFALKKEEMYLEAMDMFRELEAESTGLVNYRKETEACKQALQWKAQEAENPYLVRPIDALNTPYMDYAPVPYKDGQVAISSDRPLGKEDPTYQWTGNGFSNIYIQNPETGKAEALDGINTEYNEGTIAFNADYTEAIFSRCGTSSDEDDYCKLMRSTREGDVWSAPEVLTFVVNEVNYAHPAWSPDGKELYFAADLQDGWGGYDLYKTTQRGNGWSDPQILSAKINTEMDDMFPHFDGDTLYFASKGRGGMGGLDIYKTYLEKPGRWANPINLQAPINSGEDDFGFVVTEQLDGRSGMVQKGYFTSSRKGGQGLDDIYAFTKKKTKPEPKPATPEPQPDTSIVPAPPPPPAKDIFLEIYVYGKAYSEPNNPNSTLAGQVALADAGLQISSALGTQNVRTDSKGMHRMKIEQELDYRFFASKEDYYNASAIFNTINQGEKEVYRVDIVLDKIFRDVEINLEDIYYDYDESYIREDAKPTLNQLASLLHRNPEIKIVLGSHTDCRGREQYNQSLSQKRAQAAVDYLVSLGISQERLQATGYGESAPAVNCNCNSCSEEEHQANRRTTFRVL